MLSQEIHDLFYLHRIMLINAKRNLWNVLIAVVHSLFVKK